MRLAALLVLGLAAAGAHAQGPTLSPEVGDNVRQRVDRGFSAGIVVGLVNRAGTRYFAYGRTAAGGSLVDPRTVFEIGSITKVFTALALAEMVRRGEVGLDDPVGRHLPATVRVPRRDTVEITLRHLASHRSGLPRLPANLRPADLRNPYADYDSTRLFAFLDSHALRRAPGERYEYSNLGAGLLGFVLARRASTGYESLLVRRVLEPLGLHDTRITLTPTQRGRLARGHDGGEVVANWDLDALAGAGALRSTAEDLARFLAAAIGLVRSPLDSAFRILRHIEADAGPGMRIALGWHVIGPDSTAGWWHNGFTGGYRSFIGFDPRRGLGVVVLSNANESVDDIGFHLLDPSRPLQAVPVVAALPAESLNAYVGEYELAPNFTLTVRRAGSGLQAQATGQGSAAIYPAALDEFFYRAVQARVSFVRDSTGRVTTLVLHQGGRDLRAPRR